MVSVSNQLVKPTHSMTRSTTDELFTTLGLDGKGSKQHLKVIYDMLDKVVFSS